MVVKPTAAKWIAHSTKKATTNETKQKKNAENLTFKPKREIVYELFVETIEKQQQKSEWNHNVNKKNSSENIITIHAFMCESVHDAVADCVQLRVYWQVYMCVWYCIIFFHGHC